MDLTHFWPLEEMQLLALASFFRPAGQVALWLETEFDGEQLVDLRGQTNCNLSK